MSESTHLQILEHVQTGIRDLDLEGVDDENVVLLKHDKRLERIEAGGFPCCIVMHSGESEIYDGEGSTNAFEEIGYPVVVLMCDIDRTNEPDQELLHDRRLWWRERIVMRFLNKHLSSSPQVCRCTLSSRPIMLTADWMERSVWKSPLHFIFWARAYRWDEAYDFEYGLEYD